MQFDAGTLNGTPLRYPTSVHGPVIGTATVQGRPIALTRKRSTFGRDGLNLAALKDMTDGTASTPTKFFDAANEFGFTFNWAYASRNVHRVLLVGAAAAPRQRSRPPPADAGHRRVRVARLPERRPASTRASAAPADSC